MLKFSVTHSGISTKYIDFNSLNFLACMIAVLLKILDVEDDIHQINTVLITILVNQTEVYVAQHSVPHSGQPDSSVKESITFCSTCVLATVNLEACCP